jgi:hypothetical protein
MLGLYLAALGISGIKEAKEIHESKSKPEFLPNGIKFYNHNGVMHLYDGTIINWWANGDVQTIDGKIIYSEREEKAKKSREESLKEGKLVYEKLTTRCDHKLIIEIGTEKPIAKIIRKRIADGVYECRKWYWYDEYADRYSKDMLKGCIKVSDPCAIRPGDEGIVISDEIFEKMKKKGIGISCYYIDEKEMDERKKENERRRKIEEAEKEKRRKEEKERKRKELIENRRKAIEKAGSLENWLNSLFEDSY